MNTKEVFYKYVKKDGWGFDIIEADADGLWQWIEQYGKQQRIDELEKLLEGQQYYGKINMVIEDRIKELKCLKD